LQKLQLLSFFAPVLAWVAVAREYRPSRASKADREGRAMAEAVKRMQHAFEGVE
jgi:hypothetical protein